MGSTCQRRQCRAAARVVVMDKKMITRLERVADRLEFLLPTAEKLALHLNAQTDDATGLIFELQELKRGFAFLLNRTSRAITEKAIWDELEAHEAKLKQSRRFYDGYPGVYQKVLEKE